MSRNRECSTLHNNTVIVHIRIGEAQVDDPSLSLSEILPVSICGERMNRTRIKEIVNLLKSWIEINLRSSQERKIFHGIYFLRKENIMYINNIIGKIIS